MLNTTYRSEDAQPLPADKERLLLRIIAGEVQLAGYLLAAHHNGLSSLSEDDARQIFTTGDSFRDKLGVFFQNKHEQIVGNKDVDALSIRLHRRGVRATSVLGFIEPGTLPRNFDNSILRAVMQRSRYSDPGVFGGITNGNGALMHDTTLSNTSLEQTPVMLDGQVFDIDALSIEQGKIKRETAETQPDKSKGHAVGQTRDAPLLISNQGADFRRKKQIQTRLSARSASSKNLPKNKDDASSRSFVNLSRSPSAMEKTEVKLVNKTDIIARRSTTPRDTRSKTPEFGVKARPKPKINESAQAIPIMSTRTVDSRVKLKTKRPTLSKPKQDAEPIGLPVRRSGIISSLVKDHMMSQRVLPPRDTSATKAAQKRSSVNTMTAQQVRATSVVPKRDNTASINKGLKRSDSGVTIKSKSATSRKSTVAIFKAPVIRSTSRSSSVIVRQSKVDGKAAPRGEHNEQRSINKTGLAQKVAKSQIAPKKTSKVIDQLPLRKELSANSTMQLKSKRAIVKQGLAAKHAPTKKTVAAREKSTGCLERAKPKPATPTSKLKLSRKSHTQQFTESQLHSSISDQNNNISAPHSVHDEPVSQLTRIIDSVTLCYGKYRGYRQVPYARKLTVKGILTGVLDVIIDSIVEMDEYSSNRLRNAQELLVLRDYTKVHEEISAVLSPERKSGLVMARNVSDVLGSPFDVDRSLIKGFMFGRKETTSATTENILEELNSSRDMLLSGRSHAIEPGRRGTEALAVGSGNAGVDDLNAELARQDRSGVDARQFKLASQNEMEYNTDKFEEQRLLDILNENSGDGLPRSKSPRSPRQSEGTSRPITLKSQIDDLIRLSSVGSGAELDIEAGKIVQAQPKSLASDERASLHLDKIAQSAANSGLIQLFKKLLVYSARIEELKNAIFENNPRFNLVCVFELYDENGDGHLSQDEFVDMMLDIGVQVSEVQLRKIVQHLKTRQDWADGDVAVTFSQFLALFYPLHLDASLLCNLYQAKQDQKKQLQRGATEELVIQDSELQAMRQIINLLLRKIEDTSSLVAQLRLYRAEELFGIVTAGAKTDISWKVLCSFLERNAVQFLEEDVVHIFRDFTFKSGAFITYQNFADYFNQPVWGLDTG